MLDFTTATPRATPPRVERPAAVATAAGDPPVQTARGPDAGVEQAVERIQEYLRESRRELSFTVDDDSGRVVVIVTDPSTGETVRQIPSEEVLRIARHLSSALVDLLA